MLMHTCNMLKQQAIWKLHFEQSKFTCQQTIHHAHCLCQLYWYGDWILWFLYLCHGVSIGDWASVFPCQRPCCASFERFFNIWYCLYCKTTRCDCFWTFWRPHWAQGDLSRFIIGDGYIYIVDWLFAWLWDFRRLGRRVAVFIEVWPRFRFGWWVGWGGIISHGKRTRRQARLVWHVSTARSFDRFFAGNLKFSGFNTIFIRWCI